MRRIHLDREGKNRGWRCNLDGRFLLTVFRFANAPTEVTCRRCLTQMDGHPDRGVGGYRKRSPPPSLETPHGRMLVRRTRSEPQAQAGRRRAAARRSDRRPACLARDRDELLAFYDFPAAHWTHLRTTNVIESAFATIRHRSSRAKGCVTRQTMLSMIYKMGLRAEKSWRRLRGFRQLAKVIEGVQFNDRIELIEDSRAAA